MIFFSDVNQQDPLTQDKIYDLEDIYQSIHNILNTEKGERLFLPEFGTNIQQYLFELLTFDTERLMILEITDALDRWEPRIQVFSNLSTIKAVDNHEIYLEIVFEIKGKVSDKYLYQSRITQKQKDKFYEIR